MADDEKRAARARRSRAKGADFERHVARVLQAAGLDDARRTAPLQARFGGRDGADVTAWRTLWECKAGKSPPPYVAILIQAEDAVGDRRDVFALGARKVDRRPAEGLIALEDLVELCDLARLRDRDCFAGDRDVVRLDLEHLAALVRLARDGAES